MLLYPIIKSAQGSSDCPTKGGNNSHAALRFEFYVVPAAAECREGRSNERSSSSKRTFRTGTVEENAVKGIERWLENVERGRDKNKALLSIAVCLLGFLGIPFCKVQLRNTREARK